MGYALFLGAGFSKWTADLPLASELFDFAITPWQRESSRLARVQSAKAAWDTRNPDGLSEQFIEASLDGRSLSRDVVWYVVRRLADPYIWEEWHAQRRRRHVLSIDEYRVASRPGVAEARRFLQRIMSVDLRAILTTNYDMVVEYALGTRRFRYGLMGERLSGRGPYPVSQWQRPTMLVGRTPYLKLHGSISWTSEGRFTDGRGALTGEALIVPPTPGKAPPPALSDVWQIAERELRQSEQLVVFGFAFNEYDTNVGALLERGGRGLSRILLVDPNPPLTRARALWPAATIDTIHPGAADSVRAWLAEGIA